MNVLLGLKAPAQSIIRPLSTVHSSGTEGSSVQLRSGKLRHDKTRCSSLHLSIVQKHLVVSKKTEAKELRAKAFVLLIHMDPIQLESSCDYMVTLNTRVLKSPNS